jgi:hypothetical protein
LGAHTRDTPWTDLSAVVFDAPDPGALAEFSCRLRSI